MAVSKFEIIKLRTIDYDIRARDGTWCGERYIHHPNGCPNFPRCVASREDFKDLPSLQWYAVVVKFDIAAHAIKMKTAHPNWTDKQCRNLLYWQQMVRSELMRGVKDIVDVGDTVLDIPEASGINVFSTMLKAGVVIEPRPRNTIIKIMLVGKGAEES